MKQLMIAVCIALTGCAQLMKGEQQPVKMLDAKQQIYMTTCSGAVENWPDCHGKAKKTCPNGYDETAKSESPVGGKRELTFRCN